MRRSLVFLGVGFAALLLITLRLTQPETAQDHEEFFSLSRRTPDTLMFIHPQEKLTLIPKGRTGWTVISPYEDRADAYLVESILNTFSDLEPLRRFPYDERQSDVLGLRRPRVILRGAYRDEKPDSLCLGGLNPGSTMIYLRAGSKGDIGTMRVGDAAVLLNTREELRDRNGFPIVPSRVNELRVRIGSATHVVYKKDPEGRWVVDAPYPGPADPKAMDGLLDVLSKVRIEQFLGPRQKQTETIGYAEAEVIQGVQDTLWFRIKQPDEADRALVLAESSERRVSFKIPGSFLRVLKRPSSLYRLKRLSRSGYGDVDSLETPAAVWHQSEWISESSRGTSLRRAIENWFTLEAEEVIHGTPEIRAKWRIGGGEYRWWAQGKLLSVIQFGPELNGRRAVYISSGLEARPQELLIFSGPELTSILSVLDERVPGTR